VGGPRADQLWSSVIQGNAAADELHRLIKAAGVST